MSDDSKARRTDQLLENLEMIDDDCDTRGIHFVKIAEAGAGDKFGITSLPTLVFFRNNVPNIFEGDYFWKKKIICLVFPRSLFVKTVSRIFF